jgi:hypothetical protein
MNEDIRAYMDTFKTSMEENFRQLKQALSRSEDRNLQLTAEMANLRQQLNATKAELAAVKQESVDAALAATDRMDIWTLAATDRMDIAETRVDDLEQYGRRKSIRVQNVPVVEGEGDDIELVLQQINISLAPANIQLTEADCIRYHRSSKEKDNRDEEVGGKVSQCIVKLKHWAMRRQFQGLNKRCRDNKISTRVFHDLTKCRFALLNQAREDLKNHEGWFAYADVNSNLKLRQGKRFYSFNTAEELEVAISKI